MPYFSASVCTYYAPRSARVDPGSWFEIIKEKVKTVKLNETILQSDINPPETLEQRYYRSIFEEYYPNSAHILPYFWMPKYVNAKDASARTLSVYEEETGKDFT